MRPLQAPSGIDIKVYTKLMENYHVSNRNRSLPKGEVQSVHAFTDNDGCDIIFLCVGARVSCFYFGGGIQSSYAAASVPLRASEVVAATGANGCTYVFGHGPDDVRYCKETAPHSGAFGAETALDLPLPRNLRRVERLLVHKLDVGFAIAALSSTLDSEAYYLSYALFGQEFSSQILEMPFGSVHMGLVGANAEDLAVVALSTRYLRCRLRDRHTDVCDLRPEDRDIAWKQSEAAGECLFVLGERAGATFPAVVRVDAAGSEARVIALAEPGDCETLCAGFGLGRYHVLAQGAQLNHLDGVCVPGWFDAISPAPIERRCDAFSLCGSDTALAAYYCLDGALVRLEYDASSTSWKESKVADVSEDPVSSLPCYSTEITFTGEHMVPCAGEKLKVWTKTRTFLETPQGTYCTDEAHPLTLATDAQGKVRVLQHVDSVNSNPIFVSAEGGLLPANEVLAVNQYERQQQRFAALSADEVMDARRSSRTDTPGAYRDDPLLDDEHRTRENAEAIAKSVSQLMAATAPVNSDPCRFGTWLVGREELSRLGDLAPRDDLGAWQLAIEGNRLRYRPLERSEALRSAQSLYLDENGVALPKWMTSIGNFFRSVAKKIASVVKMVIDGVKAVVQVVLNGVKMVFEAVMGVISQVLDMVITIFIAVAVVFIAVFCWLIFHAKWDDILRCKRAFRRLAMHYLDAYPQACASTRELLDGFFADAQDKVRELFEPFAKMVGEGTSPLQYVDENKKSDPAAEEAQSNNLVLDALVGNAGAATLALPQEVRDAASANDGLIELINSLMVPIATSVAGGRAFDFMSGRVTSYDDLFSLSFTEAADVVCDMSILVLDALRQLCAFAFDSIAETCASIRTAINARVRIPVLSDIYEFIAGDDMTVLDMACLIAAIPTALLYKTAVGTWPLDADDRVDEFVAAVSALPLGPDGRQANAANALGKPLDTRWRSLLVAASSFFGCIYIVLSLTQNFVDIDRKPEPTPSASQKRHRALAPDRNAPSDDASGDGSLREEGQTLGWAMVALEFIWSATACPEATRDPDETVGWPKWLLYCYPFLGSVIDGGMVWYLGEYPDHHKTNVGRWWTLGYGVGHLLTYIVYCVYYDPQHPGKKCPEWYDFVSNLSCILMELSKIMLHSTISSIPLRSVPSVLDVVGIAGVICNFAGTVGTTPRLQVSPEHEGACS